MGQAKRRGPFDQRVALARYRKNLLANATQSEFVTLFCKKYEGVDLATLEVEIVEPSILLTPDRTAKGEQMK